MNTPTDQDKERGYSICKCGGVKLLQAGFEVSTTMCHECSEHVAEADDFSNGADILSK